MRSGYDILQGVPSVTDYNRVRGGAGLSQKPARAAERALSNTIYSVRAETDDEVVGFGRLIGDGGLYYEIVDVAVLQEHQGNGLGSSIMDSLMAYLRREAPAGAFVSLHAGHGVSELYERYGFRARSAEAPRMSQVL